MSEIHWGRRNLLPAEAHVQLIPGERSPRDQNPGDQSPGEHLDHRLHGHTTLAERSHACMRMWRIQACPLRPLNNSARLVACSTQQLFLSRTFKQHSLLHTVPFLFCWFTAGVCMCVCMSVCVYVVRGRVCPWKNKPEKCLKWLPGLYDRTICPNIRRTEPDFQRSFYVFLMKAIWKLQNTSWTFRSENHSLFHMGSPSDSSQAKSLQHFCCVKDLSKK